MSRSFTKFAEDDIARVHELIDEGYSRCAVERITGISYSNVRRILGENKSQPKPEISGELSTRLRQRALAWPAA